MKIGAMRPDAAVTARPPFDAIVGKHRRELVTYLTRLMGNRADAEDVCQDALLRAVRAYPVLQDRTHVRAWLFKIATRTAANARRSGRRRHAHRSEIDPDLLPAPAASRSSSPALLAAVDALPLRQRAAIMLRIFHDQSYAQIAAIVGGTATAARANVYQGIKRLKTVLQARHSEG
jgi:RNA polymerase sigma factor (sigma-70 family)